MKQNINTRASQHECRQWTGSAEKGIVNRFEDFAIQQGFNSSKISSTKSEEDIANRWWKGKEGTKAWGSIMNKATQQEDWGPTKEIAINSHGTYLKSPDQEMGLNPFPPQLKKKVKKKGTLALQKVKAYREGEWNIFWKREKVNTRHSLLESHMADRSNWEWGWLVGVRPSLAYGHWYRNYSIPDTNTLHYHDRYLLRSKRAEGHYFL